MTPLISLLSLYYTCDAMAELRPLSLDPDQLAQCMAYYEEIKDTFAQSPDDPNESVSTQAQRVAAYVAFKTWERDNAQIVADLRARARANVLNAL